MSFAGYMLVDSPICVPEFEKGVVSPPKARGAGNGEATHSGISQSVLTETTRGFYGPPRHFKGTEIKSYYPPSTFKTFGPGIDHSLANNPHFSLENSTVAFFKELHDLDNSSIKYRGGRTSQFAHHAGVDQVHNDVPFRNLQASITFNFQNKVAAYGSSLMKLDPTKIAPSKPRVSLEDAFRTAEELLDGQAVKRIDTDNPQKYLVYLAEEDGSAVLTYRFIVKNKSKSILFEALVDAHSGRLFWVNDLIMHA